MESYESGRKKFSVMLLKGRFYIDENLAPMGYLTSAEIFAEAKTFV
jgi:hypothetical protein